MSSILDERVEEEVEALKAILMDEVSVKVDEKGVPTTVEISVFPSTAEDHSSQYVCVTLVVNLSTNYPDDVPVIELRNPRGLDDDILHLIERELKNKMGSCRGSPVIFELIEVIKEHLTEKNVPSCQCVICLYGFSPEDEFIKTQCYHYFHSHCLASHVVNSERIFTEEQEKLPAWQRTNNYQRQCPVCREVISVDLETLSHAAPPVERECARNFELDENLKLLQKKMAALFKHQQSRGGIIDLEAEESKMLLVTCAVDEEPGSRTPAGPSIPPNMSTENRRGLTTRGRGNRGAFAAARKSRGHFTASYNSR